MLDERMKKRPADGHGQLQQEGKLFSRAKLDEYYQTFRSRFGPEAPANLLRNNFIFACILVVWFMAAALTGIPQDRQFDYFGLSSPGNKVDLFAPGIVSLKNLKTNSLAISPMGDEVFFSRGDDWPKNRIMHIRKIRNRWTAPKVAEFSTDCYATEPAFSPDGKYLYFSSSKGMKEIKNYSIWRVRKTGSGWSESRRVIDADDPTIWEFHPTVTSDSVYFCKWNSNQNTGGIYKSTYSGDTYSKPGKVTLFNAQSSDTNPFIDPRGNYLIASSKVQNSATGYDVYVFYKKGEASWSDPVRFGDAFNTKADEDSFDVSPDGKFMFLYKQGAVYWTETKGIVNAVR
jgi:hypothetical protein